MTASVSIDSEVFQSHLARFRGAWKRETESGESLGQCDAVMLTLGLPKEETVYQKTTAMFAWLLGYEFPETTMVITPDTVAFLVSQRKGAILDGIGNESVHVIKRDKEAGKSEAQFAQLFKILCGTKNVNGDGKAKIGLLPKDKNEGPMTTEWLSYLQKHADQWEPVDATVPIGVALASKDASELVQMKNAAQVTTLVMTEQAIPRLLTIVDGERRVKHSQFSEDLEGFVTNHMARLRAKMEPNISLDFIDICYPPIIQSGGTYELKPSALSTDEPIAFRGVVLCSVGLRYRAYCANMSRTLLIDPSPTQESVLTFARALQHHLAAHLVDGVALNDLHQVGVDFVRRERPELEKHLVPNFGFGIGIEFREPEFLISARIKRQVQAGMTFNLMVGFKDLSNPEAKDAASKIYAVMLADTVQAGTRGSTGATFLTKGLDQLSEVSFSFKKTTKSALPSGPIIQTRQSSRRQGGIATIKDESAEKRRREHQRELGQQRVKEALERYASADADENKRKTQEVLKFESYRKDTLLPKEVSSPNPALRIFVDKRGETVILPIYGLAVPFHINTIKNVTKNEEGDFVLIRFNFNSPGRTIGKKDTNLPSGNDPKAHFIRGITIRCSDALRAQEIYKEIQDLRKQVSEREAARKERADLVEQGQLVEVTGRRPARLPDIYVRPGLDGKRLPGDLEIHVNGLRYRSQIKADQRIEVLFSNVKHFFFQPCDQEAMVILHLHLHHPIIVGKKKTKDIQFYREALESLVDETSGRRTRMRFGDEDEIAQEQEERRRRAEANEEFRNFAERVVEASKKTLGVDVPFRDLGFSGVPARQNVLMQPTTECLVQLIEPPFTIVTLAEVEVAFLERVVFGLKNFDLVFIFKDHSKETVHINTIPMTQLETVKEWLNSVDVYYVESKVNFNWNNIMKTVNEDPVGFYEMGGWTYLQPDEKAGDADDDESSEFEPGDEVFEEDEEESEEEDEEEYEDEDEDEYSDEEDEEFSEEDEEEESDAPDWDDLEEEARIEDERSAKRKALPARKPAPPPKRR